MTALASIKQTGAGMVPMFISRPQTGPGEAAWLFLFRRDYLDHHEHEMWDRDAFLMACRVREDAAHLIGFMA